MDAWQLTNKTIESKLLASYSLNFQRLKGAHLNSQCRLTHTTIAKNCYPPVIHFCVWMIRIVDRHSNMSSAPQNSFRASVTNVENQYASVVKSSGRSRADLETRQAGWRGFVRT